MNSRERILLALEHKEADRVPIDFAGTDCSSIYVLAYNRLTRLLAYDLDPPRLILPEHGIVEADVELRDRFAGDTLPLAFYPRVWREWLTADGAVCQVPDAWRPERLPDGTMVLRDEGGTIRSQRPPGSPYFDSVNPPLANVTSPSELSRYNALFERWDWPPVFDEPIEAYGERARELRAHSDRAIIALWRMHFLQSGQIMRGYEQFLIDLLSDEPLVRAIFDKLLEIYIERARKFLAVMRDAIDIIFITDDLGMQTGPMIDPPLFRRLIKPYLADLFAFLKKESGKPILMHSCGSVRKFIPDLIEIGVDALHPVQVSAHDMNPADLKRDFGKDIAFWGGGCDTQSVLNNGTRKQVADEVKRRIDAFAPGGGFVFTQVHNIQGDVAPENIITLYDTAREYGLY